MDLVRVRFTGRTVMGDHYWNAGEGAALTIEQYRRALAAGIPLTVEEERKPVTPDKEEESWRRKPSKDRPQTR